MIADKTVRNLNEIPISEAMTRNLVGAKKNITITECAPRKKANKEVAQENIDQVTLHTPVVSDVFDLAIYYNG